MWQKTFITETRKVTKEQVWAVLTDINKWHEWDEDIEWASVKVRPTLHTAFVVKPRGGRHLNLKIMQFDKPVLYTDLTYLPLAKMYTSHRLTESKEGLKIQVDIWITGPLTFLWSRMVGHKQKDGGLLQTHHLINKAKTIDGKIK